MSPPEHKTLKNLQTNTWKGGLFDTPTHPLNKYEHFNFNFASSHNTRQIWNKKNN